MTLRNHEQKPRIDCPEDTASWFLPPRPRRPRLGLPISPHYTAGKSENNDKFSDLMKYFITISPASSPPHVAYYLLNNNILKKSMVQSEYRFALRLSGGIANLDGETFGAMKMFMMRRLHVRTDHQGGPS